MVARRTVAQLGAALLFSLAITSTARAEAIIKFNLDEAFGEFGPDVAFDGTTFHTLDDGNAVTTGNQDTSLEFVGLLNFIPDSFAQANSAASFTLADVTASGAGQQIGNLVVQNTTGGTFSIYDSSNNLLLSGTLDQGALAGGVNQSTGSFFNVSSATFTSGSLLAYVAPVPAGLSLALSGIVNSSGGAGLALGCAECAITGFQAAAVGTIDGLARPGSAIPEPASLALLVSGGLMGIFVRRRRQA